ncbi:MAG TPA: hypothetical protein VGI40_23630 [Pirellulaceae bacterium]
MSKSLHFALLLAVVFTTTAISQDEPPSPTRTVPPPPIRGAAPGARGGFIPGGAGGFGQPAPSSATAPSESSARTGLTLRPIPPSRPLPTTIGKTLTFDVLIAGRFQAVDSPTAERILELEKAGKLDYANRLQITTLEDLPAYVQFGTKTARVVGRTNTGLTITPIYNDVNLGSILQVTGRVNDDGTIVAQVFVEQMFLAGGEEIAFDPQANLPPKAVEQQFAQSTVRLKPGEPQTIGGHQAAVGHESSQTWIVVTGCVGK